MAKKRGRPPGEEGPPKKKTEPNGATAGVTAGTGGAPEKVVYRIEHGLRHVEPYDFDFCTHVKQRWVGRTLIEVFAREFVAYPEPYYRAAIEAGRVTVDGMRVTPGHMLRQNERIVHRAVRCRENPVLDVGHIPVVAETKDLLVVSKPSSLPIHPCGSYRFNSLIALLREQGTVEADAALHTTHRLDRLTSGLVLFAKSKAAARKICAWFAGSEIRKTYLARVRGSCRQLFDREAGALPAGVARVEGASDRIRVGGYIRCVDHKVGKYEFSATPPEAGEESKDAATEFEYIGEVTSSRGTKESVVRCHPFTGRTHQIRVHLLHLGYPIANDFCYGGELRDDPSLPLIPHVHQSHAGVISEAEGKAAEGPDGGKAESPDGGKAAEGAGEGDTAAGRGAVEGGETKMHSSGIFLHALTYALPDGSFSCEIPQWAACS